MRISIIIIYTLILIGCNSINSGINIIDKSDNDVTFSLYCPCSLSNYKCDQAIDSYYLDECIFYITSSPGIDSSNREWFKYAAMNGGLWGEAAYGMQYLHDLDNTSEYIPWLKISARRGVHKSIAEYAKYLIQITDTEEQVNNTLCWARKAFLVGEEWIINTDILNIAFNPDQMLISVSLLYTRSQSLSESSVTKEIISKSISNLTEDISVLEIQNASNNLIQERAAIEKPNTKYEQLLLDCD